MFRLFVLWWVSGSRTVSGPRRTGIMWMAVGSRMSSSRRTTRLHRVAEATGSPRLTSGFRARSGAGVRLVRQHRHRRAPPRPAGRAAPFQIHRHVHPKARTVAAPPATPTGIDYLRLVEDRHTSALGRPSTDSTSERSSTSDCPRAARWPMAGSIRDDGDAGMVPLQ